MSSEIDQCISRRNLILEFGRRLRIVVIATSLCWLFLSADIRMPSVAASQDPQEIAKTRNGPTIFPDLDSLIRDSDRLGAAMHLKLPEYTYLQTRLSRELDQRGKTVEHESVYEAYPIELNGHQLHVLSLISEDGARISPKRLMKERRQAAKVMGSAERENSLHNHDSRNSSAGNYLSAGIGLSHSGEGVWIGVSQFLRQCRFGEPRYSRIADRDAIAINIVSCSSDPSDPQLRYLEAMAGVVWIDSIDKMVVRLEAWPRCARPGFESTLPDQETLVYEQMRLPNGLWVPKRIRLNALGKAGMFNGTDKDMTFEFSQYQRFNTEVGDLQQFSTSR